jgi:hypothetical protein
MDADRVHFRSQKESAGVEPVTRISPLRTCLDTEGSADVTFLKLGRAA